MLSQKVLLHRTHQLLCVLAMWDITASPKHPQAFSAERQRSPDRDGQFQVCWVGKDFAAQLFAVPKTPACALHVLLHCVVFWFWHHQQSHIEEC